MRNINEDDWMADEIENLLSEDGECYPFANVNIIEALSNLNFVTENEVCSYIYAAGKLPNNGVAQVECAKKLVQAIKQYWNVVAENKAQSNWFDRDKNDLSVIRPY